MDPGRRLLLLRGARLAGLAALAQAGAFPTQAARNGNRPYPFALGVASGSPLPDSVILWTRILHDPLNPAATPPVAMPVRWEVAEDVGFRIIAARGSATAAPE